MIPKLCCGKPRPPQGMRGHLPYQQSLIFIKLCRRSCLQVSDVGITCNTNELLGFVVSSTIVQKSDSSFWNIFPLFLFESLIVHLKAQAKFREINVW